MKYWSIISYCKSINSIAFICIVMIYLLNNSGCKSSTEPNDDSINNEYMSLNIGDIRQFYMPYNSGLTEHSVWKVTGKTHRSDGLEVFISEWYILNYSPQNKTIEYNFIKDGYYYYTKLDSTTDVPGNPFFEQRLAKIRPNNGDKWLQTSASYFDPKYPIDSVKAAHLDSYSTPAGVFKDVFSFEFTGGGKSYYAKYFGYIGAAFSTDPNDLFIANYVKIKGKEMGKYFKMDSLLTKSTNISYNKIKMLNYLGESSK